MAAGCVYVLVCLYCVHVANTWSCRFCRYRMPHSETLANVQRITIMHNACTYILLLYTNIKKIRLEADWLYNVEKHWERHHARICVVRVRFVSFQWHFNIIIIIIISIITIIIWTLVSWALAWCRVYTHTPPHSLIVDDHLKFNHAARDKSQALSHTNTQKYNHHLCRPTGSLNDVVLTIPLLLLLPPSPLTMIILIMYMYILYILEYKCILLLSSLLLSIWK